MRRPLCGLLVLLAAAAARGTEPDTRLHPGIALLDWQGAASSDATVCAGGTTVEGIDVSHWDGAIDWAKVAGSGRTFAIAKATEGTSFLDPQFHANWTGMKAAGLVRGAYHFFRPADSGAQQADWFLSSVGGLAAGDLPPVLDWEVTDSVANAVDVQGVQDFVDRVRARTGLTTIVYTSARFLSTVGNPTQFASLPLWDANWNVSCPNIPAAWGTWTIWQYSATGVVAGVDPTVSVDLNRFNGTAAQLQALTVQQGGTDGGADAGSADAGPSSDGGGADAGGVDAGVPHDGGADAGAPPQAFAHTGCGSTGAAADGAILLAAALAAAVARRARGRRAAAAA
jgi:lysozyme